ncbi:hypothetical protein DEM27_08265 [Metarhizobium album]|uniref:DUF4214 domain-containing protein n=1 Tax=Metarhizobium album TaxID=2182425 RepID=A0A2U2DSU5_9HYPH|nr:DUF4214 domain-containing protein [Rhizobium album]PWE56384.1 hypothetical protein DEM27_08265 [Rhizobium album]
MATIQGIYVALFGRPADPAGLAFFNEATNNGADLTAIGDLASTTEYQSRFTGMTNEQIINSIYQSLFERDGEAEGVDFYVGELEAGRLNINNIAIAILDGAKNEDLDTVNAKIAAANLFTSHLDQTNEVEAYAGADAAAVGRDYLASIDTQNPGTGANADAAILLLLDEQGGNEPGTGGGGGGGGVSTFTLEQLLYDYAPGTEPAAYNLAYGPDDLGSIEVKDLVRIPGIIEGARNDALYQGYTAKLDDTLANIETVTDGQLNAISEITAKGDGDIDNANFSHLSRGLTILGGDGGTGMDSGEGLIGGTGDDWIYGGTGKDYLHGNDGDDVIYGLDGDDVLQGNKGDDTLYGGVGEDRLHGGQGNDYLYGEDGNDQLFGNLGDDFLDGGAGHDTIELEGAGSGSDQVLLATVGSSSDTINGFTSGDDKLVYNNANTTSDADAFGEIASRVGIFTDGTLNIQNGSQFGVIEFEFGMSGGDLSTGSTNDLFNGLRTDGNLFGLIIPLSADKIELNIDDNGAWSGFLVAYQNNNAYVYYADSADDTITAGEVELVATVTGVAQGGLTSADFVGVTFDV